jgi:hypothetical protein
VRLSPDLLCALGAAGLALAGCVESEPAASGDQAANAAASPDTPVSSDAGTDAPDAVAASDAASDCNAEEARRFVGEKADDATRARLLAAVKPVSAVRWVGPGDATTEDYSLSRLNVMLDVGGTIVSAHCG